MHRCHITAPKFDGTTTYKVAHGTYGSGARWALGWLPRFLFWALCIR